MVILFTPLSKCNTNLYINYIDWWYYGVFASSMVDCGLEHWSGQTKDNQFGVCCFFAKHITLRSKSQNQDKVSEWSDTSLPADCELVGCKNPT